MQLRVEGGTLIVSCFYYVAPFRPAESFSRLQAHRVGLITTTGGSQMRLQIIIRLHGFQMKELFMQRLV
jgi:hypothetical protein